MGNILTWSGRYISHEVMFFGHNVIAGHCFAKAMVRVRRNTEEADTVLLDFKEIMYLSSNRFSGTKRRQLAQRDQSRQWLGK